ncbi:dephospho-CoA kinase-like [Symsagittifera roscoffensis]|uniref:dephospho-CoA kinase-like n=1 Tax=Symsagittifera roscoffensis TaxID=84072 RepID=UPI00307B3445
MFLVGLTGGIGSGKSTVTSLLRNHAVTVFDLDEYARLVVQRGEPALTQIAKLFGPDVLLPDGNLDRPKLGKIIFADESKRKSLNAIVHPAIYRRLYFDLFVCFLKGKQFAVLDVPLLFETKRILSILNCTIVVWCRRDQQVERLKGRNADWSGEEVENRINAQISLDEKRAYADHVILNDGPMENLLPQVEKVIEVMKKRKSHWKFRLIAISAVTGLCLITYTALNYVRNWAL